MVRSWVGALTLLLAIAVLPQRAAAGGTEFPADGTRNLGRGGAGMARADDPSVMIRNPALLADLWGNQALLGAHLSLVDSCFHPSGAYGVGAVGPDVVRLGDQIVGMRLSPGTTLADGTPIPLIENEPYATACYEGPAPFLPRVALTMKIAPDLGVGIGFFPPDNSSLNQFGNRDGTVDTANGPRPNQLRFIRAHLNTSYFSVLSAVGYRAADWLRIGFGFQWQLVVFQSRSFSPATSISGLRPSGDVRSDAFGRDLFVPGLIGSVHIKPFDALDIALGAKWSDRVMAKAKLDLTAGAFGTGEVIPAIDGATGMETLLGSTIPTTTHNQGADVSAGPVWVPQLSAGIRYADRFKPRVSDKDWGAVQKAGGDTSEDSMETERWDLELDFIYYLTSFQDRTDVQLDAATVNIRTIDSLGNESGAEFSVGDCIVPNRPLLMGEVCERRQVLTRIEGKDQMTLRVGGDYNVLPGLFTVRAGGSYETSGQDPEWMSPFQYMADRKGLHAGFTVRLMHRTDISFGFAYFIQKEVRLQVDSSQREGDWRIYRTDPGMYFLADGKLDGTAKIEIPNSGRPEPGPYFVNGGAYFYDLSVLSASISQKF